MISLLLVLFLLFSPFAFAHGQDTTGATPTLSTCGTSPSISGNDMAGVVTGGTDLPTACTMTFARTWKTAPVCVFTSSIAAADVIITAVSSTAITVDFNANDSILMYYHCTDAQ